MLSCALALVSLVLAASSQPPCDGSGDSGESGAPCIHHMQCSSTVAGGFTLHVEGLTVVMAYVSTVPL